MIRALAALLSAVVGLVLVMAVLEIAGTTPPVSLRAEVQGMLGHSGVDHPVTAVLLNFRSYDTLLEIAVLVVAGMTGLSQGRVTVLEAPHGRTADTLLHALVRWLVPLVLVFAAYLLWAGGHRPGGAFQAGAVLAAAGVLMRLAGIPQHFLNPELMLRSGFVAGFAAFLLVALLGAVSGGAFLAYPDVLVGELIVAVEILLALSIAMVLMALFALGPVNGRSS
jgi:multisubunit Na+/H+ antiporter MnhB subunit